jgi:hypothetical protein
MSNPLRWVFELQDHMSASAKTIAGSLGEVQEGAEKASSSILEFAEGVGLERIAEKALDLGKQFASAVFEANRFATETKIAFDVLAGSQEKGSEMFERVRNFAINAGAPLESVAASYKALLLGGVAENQILAIANATSSLAALGPKGVSMESWAQAFADIASRGELSGRALMQFKGVLDFKVLAKELGHAGEGARQLMTTLNSTPVTADKGINAILLALQAKEGGILGETRAKLADTFHGTIESIKTELLSLFEFNTGDSPILEFLHGLRDALRPGSPLITEVKAGAAAFLEGLGAFQGPGGLDSFLASLRNGTVFGENFRATMKEIGETVRAVADAVVSLGHALATAAHYYNEFKGSAVGKAIQIQQDVFTGRAFLPGSAAQTEIGAATGAIGDLLPHFAEGGHVDGPTLAVVGEGGEGESIVPDSKAGARLHAPIHQEIHVHGVQATDMQTLAKMIHDLGLGELQGALDTLAQGMGVN